MDNGVLEIETSFISYPLAECADGSSIQVEAVTETRSKLTLLSSLNGISIFARESSSKPRRLIKTNRQATVS